MARGSAQKALRYDRHGNVASGLRAEKRNFTHLYEETPILSPIIFDALISPAIIFNILLRLGHLSLEGTTRKPVGSAFPDSDPTMILGLLLLLSSLAYHATSTLINLRPPTLNRIQPQCYTPDVDIELTEVNPKDCRDTLLQIARAPNFLTPRRYSKNSRRGLPLPIGWKSGDCLIFVSCENDRDAYTFRIADVLPPAKKVVDNCVDTQEDPKWGLLRWGGLENLGNSGSFYVSVSKPKHPMISTGNVVPMRLVNETLIDPVVEVS